MKAKVKWEPGVTLAELEREALRQALEHFDGSTGAVARELGISERTVQKAIHLYGLDEFRKTRGRPRKSEPDVPADA